MLDDPPVTLYVTFRTPSSLQDRTDRTIHERRFENVPESVARGITDDFARHSNQNGRAKQRKLYRFETSGRKDSSQDVLLPIDFGEVVSLAIVSPGTSGNAAPADGPTSSASGCR